MTAILCFVVRRSSFVVRETCRNSQSAANLSSAPMFIGLPFAFNMHAPSHWSSCGQTLPQTPGRLFFSLMTFIASSNFLFFMASINLGISISTGHFVEHLGFLQKRQRLASFTASSSDMPSATSLKFLILSFGDCFFIVISLVSYTHGLPAL